MPPGGSTALYRWILGLDVRHVLPSIQVPTLVLHGKDNIHHRIDHGRYLVERIPDSRFVELDGSAAVPFHAGDTTALLDAIEEFVTERHTAATDRMLSTVLFTDIVGSTDMAASVGDQQWLDLLQVHNRVSAEHVERFRGQLRKNTGDGVLATFDGPASAVTCALRLVKAVQELGIQIRAGLHTGEIVVRDSEVGGIGVHIASRVMSKANRRQSRRLQHGEGSRHRLRFLVRASRRPRIERRTGRMGDLRHRGVPLALARASTLGDRPVSLYPKSSSIPEKQHWVSTLICWRDIERCYRTGWPCTTRTRSR